MSLLEMSLTSELTRSKKGLYHAQINPAYGEDRAMTEKDWLRAADILEAELKLTGQKRIAVMHEKNGRLHLHVAWERYDHATGKMISDSHSRRAQNRARIMTEKEFQHKRTPEKNIKRPALQLILQNAWQERSTGEVFIQAMAQNGYIVSRGNRRPFMIVDDRGRSFDMVREMKGIKTKEIREVLKGYELPDEEKTRQAIRKRQEKEKSRDILLMQYKERMEKQRKRPHERGL
jgi:hypothetical protein